MIDMRGMNMAGMNRTYIARDGANSKATEDFYPQLLAAAFICHPPRWIQAVWRVLRPLFPARFVEKVDLIAPATNPPEMRRLLKYVAPEHLPTRFGGQLEAWPPPLGDTHMVFD